LIGDRSKTKEGNTMFSEKVLKQVEEMEKEWKNEMD
jgi:hypothetical protein